MACDVACDKKIVSILTNSSIDFEPMVYTLKLLLYTDRYVRGRRWMMDIRDV